MSTMKIECPCCGTDIEMLPPATTEQQARQALRAVLIWYGESPIREIQMADAACGRKFPIKEIEAALLPVAGPETGWAEQTPSFSNGNHSPQGE